MEFEEWIKKTAKDEEDLVYIPCEIATHYYPFKNSCPIDGKRCAKEGCESYKDTKCLRFEVNRLMYQILGPGDPRWRFYSKDFDDGWLSWRISVGDYYPETKDGPNRTGISVGSDNEYITCLVFKELGWEEWFGIEEYSTTTYFPQIFESLPKIQEFLEIIRDNKDLFEEKLIKYHTCVKCGRVCNFITFYEPNNGLCGKCEREIVEDWLKSHRK